MSDPDLRPSEDFDPQLLRLAFAIESERERGESAESEDALLERLLSSLERYTATGEEDRDALLNAAPALRSVLCDVAAAEAELAAGAEAETRSTPSRAAADNLATAAIDAFARSQVPASLAGEEAAPERNGLPTPAARTSDRVLHAHRPAPSILGWLGTRAAAAVLLVGFGVAIIALSGILRERALDDEGPRAEAGLQLSSVAHYQRTESGVASAAMPVSAEHDAFVPVGRRFAPEAGRVIVFGFGHASHLVVGEGGAVRVASGEQLDARLMARATKDLASDGRAVDLAAVLRLDAGEAQLDARAGRPVLLAVDGDGLLVLWNGACHVAISADAPAIALTRGSRARFYSLRADDVEDLELEGPSRMLLTADGVQDGGAPADALFRDLQLFGGDLMGASSGVEYRVAATLWRRLGGAATRRGGRFHVALHADAHGTAAEPARLAFEPVRSLRTARALRVALRAPAGTRVSLRAHPAAAADPARVLAVEEVLDRDTRAEDPGIAQITLALPADWFARLDGGELVLVITRPDTSDQEAGSRRSDSGSPKAGAKRMEAVFDGVAFAFAAARDVPSGGADR